VELSNYIQQLVNKGYSIQFLPLPSGRGFKIIVEYHNASYTYQFAEYEMITDVKLINAINSLINKFYTLNSFINGISNY
jgi:hypothetical protein